MKGLRHLGPRAGALVSVRGFRIPTRSLKSWSISHHQVLENFNLLDLCKSSVTRRKMAPLLEAQPRAAAQELRPWTRGLHANCNTGRCHLLLLTAFRSQRLKNLPKTRVGKSSAPVYPQLLSGWGKTTPDSWMLTVWEGEDPHNSWLIKPASMASEQSIGRRKSQGEPERVQVNCFSTVIETPKVPINLPTAMIV